jgi:hypothetical protein
MPQVEFELTIPVFERAKTVHALDRAAAVVGYVVTLLFFLIPLAPSLDHRADFSVS